MARRPGKLAKELQGFREPELGQRVRKPITDFVFSDRWGKVSQLVIE